MCSAPSTQPNIHIETKQNNTTREKEKRRRDREGGCVGLSDFCVLCVFTVGYLDVVLVFFVLVFVWFWCPGGGCGGVGGVCWGVVLWCLVL